MKKVVALLLILGLAGVASAGLEVVVGGGKATAQGDLTGDMYLIMAAGNGGVLSNFALGSKAPDLSTYVDTAEFFAGYGVPVPAGFVGQGWVMASSSNPYPLNGDFLKADFALGKVGEETVVRQEEGQGGYWEITDLYNLFGGAIALFTFDEASGQAALAFDGSFADRAFGAELSRVWVPEPMTLALLGLGALAIRRKK